MSQVTAAFVCALCDPDDPRPASIMCSNNCGRYVCAEHAVSRKGPGSAMVCLSCAEALGILNRTPAEAKPAVAPPVAAAATPPPKAETTVAVKPVVVAPKPDERVVSTPPHDPLVRPEPTATLTSRPITSFTPPAPDEKPFVPGAVPADKPSDAARRITEPEAPPKSVASETVVSQRGNTLQVPKVTQTLGRPPQPLGKPRLAQRAESAIGMNRQALLLAVGAIVLGIIGFALIVAALQ